MLSVDLIDKNDETLINKGIDWIFNDVKLLY